MRSETSNNAGVASRPAVQHPWVRWRMGIPPSSTSADVVAARCSLIHWETPACVDVHQLTRPRMPYAVLQDQHAWLPSNLLDRNPDAAEV